MPDLLASLRNHDLGYLQIVAELWRIDLHSNEFNSAVEELTASLLDPDLIRELVDWLDAEARLALTALASRQGRMPWAEFSRPYGEIRDMGAGRRDREKPYLKPISAAESLYYRALLARAFFDTPGGPKEFAIVPEDLLALLPDLTGSSHPGVSPGRAIPLGRAAAAAEYTHEVRADDRILDDATTMLAALRIGIPVPELSVPTTVVDGLLRAAGLIKKSGPLAEPVKAFLEMARPAALRLLIEAWRESDTFNELRLLPGLVFEGEWKNSPRAARTSILGFLASVPKHRWWSLTAFLQDVKNAHADFQRPAGDYDSWFIRRLADGEYLRGFASWEDVDGALIRFFVVGMLHWLGISDFASAGSGEIAAFRLSNPEARQAGVEEEKIHVSSKGIITVPRRAARALRYQIARFCEWGVPREDEYRYHVTPASLQRARAQGLKADQLLPMLAKYSPGVPPALVKAITRWEQHGTEARIQNQVVLRVARPEVMEKIRKSRAGRFLGEVLSPTAVVIKESARTKVSEVLAELGVLTDDSNASDSKESRSNGKT